MTEPTHFSRLFLGLAALMVFLTGMAACGSSGKGAGEAASGTATALVGNAQSTALVLQAQSMATALVQTLGASQPGSATALPPAQTMIPTFTPASQAASNTVEIVAVTTAADGAYIMVQFRGPAKVVNSWYQGKVSVTDEATGAVYAEIPSVGTIGPLISHPNQDAELGYVMLVNQPVPLKAGAVVTVVLGDFKQEHLPVQ